MGDHWERRVAERHGEKTEEGEIFRGHQARRRRRVKSLQKKSKGTKEDNPISRLTMYV